MGNNKIYLFIHVICCVADRAAMLTKPVRTVLFSYMQKTAEQKGIRMLAVNGIEDHLHCVLQLLPAQNLAQVMSQVKEESAQWLDGNKLLDTPFQWEDSYAAYTISPSQVKQVIDYVNKQEEHHKTKSLENEMEIFDKIQL